MVISEIINEVDGYITTLFQLCDSNDGSDDACLWFPYNEWNVDYDYYFIREEMRFNTLVIQT